MLRENVQTYGCLQPFFVEWFVRWTQVLNMKELQGEVLEAKLCEGEE